MSGKLLAALEWAVRVAFASVPQMPTADLAALQQSRPADLVLLDVRTSAEFAVSHIPGARHWVGSASDFTPPASGTVVLYCSVGYRSSEMARSMSDRYRQQYPDVRFVNLQGSLFRWALEGRPMVDASGQATQKVHGFSPLWARLLPADRVVLPPQP